VSVLAETREKIAYVCEHREVDPATPVTVRPLSVDEAIGNEVDGSFAIRRGREVVIEATVDDARGQAFTDRPTAWSGTLEEVFALPLDDVRHRAIVVATLNALAAKLDLGERVLHCREGDPLHCGPELAADLRRRYPDVEKVLLIGLQPAILDALVDALGVAGVRAVDLDAENIGLVRSGVHIGDGDADIAEDVAWCDVMLVTGSSIVNDTLDEILAVSRDASKPVIFFGNTIAAVAAVAELERVCPLGLN